MQLSEFYLHKLTLLQVQYQIAVASNAEGIS